MWLEAWRKGREGWQQIMQGGGQDQILSDGRGFQ